MIEELIKQIEKKYRIKCPKVSLIRESPDNFVYLLEDHSNKYILRISKRDIRDDVLFELTWLDYLENHHIPVAEVIKTVDDRLFDIYQQKTIVIFKFVEGERVEIKPDKKPNLAKVANAALELAKIHNTSLTTNINLKRKRNIFTEVNRALAIKDELIDHCEGGEKFVKELKFYKDFAKKWEGELSLIHNDFHPGNLLLEDNKVSAILDFDWAYKGPAIKDLAHALVLWSYPDGASCHWPDVFDTFFESYNRKAINKIKKDENLYRWICFSCLSDTATWITDLAKEKIYKKINGSYMYKKYLYFGEYIKSTKNHKV
jgi:Ser/Thr protein kinase RdoA (MazF antagonist)